MPGLWLKQKCTLVSIRNLENGGKRHHGRLGNQSPHLPLLQWACGLEVHIRHALGQMQFEHVPIC